MFITEQGLNDFDDYYNRWIHTYKPLEDEHGAAWRRDLGGDKRRPRSGTWTRMSCVFEVGDYYVNLLGEEEGRAKCREIFNSIPKGRRGKPNVNNINERFKAEQKVLGIYSAGRKVGSKNVKGKKTKKGQPEGDTTFTAAIVIDSILCMLYALWLVPLSIPLYHRLAAKSESHPPPTVVWGGT